MNDLKRSDTSVTIVTAFAFSLINLYFNCRALQPSSHYEYLGVKAGCYISLAAMFFFTVIGIAFLIRDKVHNYLVDRNATQAQ